MKLLNPFSAPILYQQNCQVSNREDIIEWASLLYNQSEKPVLFYDKGFTTYFDPRYDKLHQSDIFFEVSNLILSHAMEYAKAYSLDIFEKNIFIGNHKEIELKKLWCNINPPGAYQDRHHHAEYLFGGTYYVLVPQNSGSIRFTNPNQFAYYSNHKPSEETFCVSAARLNTKDDDLLIWPGWMDHEVTTNNTSDEVRITLSFALDWK